MLLVPAFSDYWNLKVPQLPLAQRKPFYIHLSSLKDLLFSGVANNVCLGFLPAQATYYTHLSYPTQPSYRQQSELSVDSLI